MLYHPKLLFLCYDIRLSYFWLAQITIWPVFLFFLQYDAKLLIVLRHLDDLLLLILRFVLVVADLLLVFLVLEGYLLADVLLLCLGFFQLS